MLTAFTYYDPEEEGRIQHGIKDSRFFNYEQGIVEEFAKEHHGILRAACPSCGQADVWPIFGRMGIKYEHCRSCSTIFSAVKDEDVETYFGQPRLKKLRLSDDYQDYAEKNRSVRWDELLDWLGFRAFRYLGRNEGLHIVDYGNRWKGFVKRIKSSPLCGSYVGKDSLLTVDENNDNKKKIADIVLAINYLEKVTRPCDFFQAIYEELQEGGLLVFSIKAGNGFDILKLGGNNPSLLPFEHNYLPSRVGIERLLDRTGFDLLEYTTPGTFDLNYVISNADKLDEQDFFMRYFLNNTTPNIKAEFQRFLQRSGMSSYAQLIARKRVGK